MCCMLPNKNKAAQPYYTPLVLDTHETSAHSKIKMKSKKSKKTRPKKLMTYIPVDNQETSPEYLLKTRQNKILVVGKPGIGKTTVTHQMLNLWTKTVSKELDYMFYFDMREMSRITNPMTLESLLFDLYCEPEENKTEVLKDILKNSDNVIIIFDGLTDLSSPSVVKRLVEKDLLCDAKIVITCRPEIASEDVLSEWSTLRVEVKGFSDESI